MRLIDANELIKVKFHPMPYTHIVPVDLLKEQTEAYERGWNDAIDAIMECVETVESQQWVPVSERLPNGEEYIQCNGLFIVSDGDRAYAEYFDIYDKKCFGEPVMHGFRADRAVTAWMPLPEPWKGGEE